MFPIVIFFLCLFGQSASQFVCFRGTSCAEDESRPVFTVGESMEDCCGMPYILATREHSSLESCSQCGPLTARQVTSATVVLRPPETLVLEISTSSYSAITWIHNGNVMHDFPRLDLENFSKRLLIYNTTRDDYGVYEADVHPVHEGQVKTLTFLVLPASNNTLSMSVTSGTITALTSSEPFATPTPTVLPTFNVTAWPKLIEVNLYQDSKTVMFFCEGTGTEALFWTTSINDSLSLNSYCASDGSGGEAPLDFDTIIEPTTTNGNANDDSDYSDYFTDERPATSEIFLGEAPQTLFPTPATVLPTTELPLLREQSIQNISPHMCTVETAISAGSLLSILTIDSQLLLSTLPNEVTFTCAAGKMIGSSLLGNSTNSTSTVGLVFTDTPFFMVRPRPTVNTIISLYVQLECVVIGRLAPNVTWYLRNTEESTTAVVTSNGRIDENTQTSQDLSGYTRSLLSISNIQVSDATEYVCQASNNEGTSETVSKLFVRVPANITKRLLDYSTTLFRTATFVCQSVGVPIPNVFWARIERNGSLHYIDDMSGASPSSNTSVVSISTITNTDRNWISSSLVIRNVQLSDEGKYLCVTSNGITLSNLTDVVDRAAAFFDVRTVVITVVGKSNTYEEGSTIVLSCTAEGTSTPQITWLRNGKPISLNSSEITESNVDPMENMAKYTITRESFGDGNSFSQLIIRGALPGVENDEGEYICRVDVTIDDGTAATVIVDTVRLYIQARNDCMVEAGVTPCQNNASCVDVINGYMCTCSGLYGGINCSEPASTEEIPIILVGPENQIEVEIFQRIAFTCSATGDPQPIYSWHKDSEFITNTSEGRLQILEVRPESRGLYTCIAHNAFGSSIMSTAGQLSLRGVYQYLVTFTDCTTNSFDELVTLMINTLSGRTLQDVYSTRIYSVTPRPVSGQVSPVDQVVITVVIGREYQIEDGSTRNIQDALFMELESFSDTYGCLFTSIVRFDGCPLSLYTFNDAYSAVLFWSETEINSDSTIICPCGGLDPDVHGLRSLSRTCGGTYTYGAVWDDVLDGCGYSINAFELCNIATLDIADQFEEIVDATEDAQLYNSLDISIASAIMRQLVLSDDIISNIAEIFSKTFSNLLRISRDTVKESQHSFGSASSLLSSIELFGLKIQLQETGSPTKFTQDLIKIQVEKMRLSDFSGHTFTQNLVGMTEVFQNSISDSPLMGASISLPTSVSTHVRQLTNSTAIDISMSPDDLRVINFLLLQNSLFVSEVEEDFGDQTLGNVFIAASLSFPEKIMDLMDPVKIDFILTEGLNNTNVTSNATCVFWDQPKTGSGKWSSEGCKLVSMEGSMVQCECNHLTHFGVLLAIDPLPPIDNPEVQLSLQVITYVGIVLSLFCISTMLLTLIFSKNLRKRAMNRMVVNMCIPLGLFYVWFLVAVHGRYYTSVTWFCYICSACVQYFLLVYLCWTSIETFHIYLKLVKVFGIHIHYFFLKAAVVAWGIPLIITAICAGFGIVYNFWAVYNLDNSLYICYPTQWPLYFGVIAPFVLVFVFNLVFFVIIMVSLSRRFHNQKKIKPNFAEKNNLKELRHLITIAICLSVMFGLGWVFGLLVQIPSPIISLIAQYIFSVFVGFQGVLIFILHGLRSVDVRKQWKQWGYRLRCCIKTPSELLSSSGPSYLSSGKKALKQQNRIGRTASMIAGKRHSENPIYQSQNELDETNEETSPPNGKRTVNRETMSTVVPHITSEIFSIENDWDKLSDGAESQTVEVNLKALDESSDDEAEIDLTDIRKVPFYEGDLGTALGPNFQWRFDDDEDKSMSARGTDL